MREIILANGYWKGGVPEIIIDSHSKQRTIYFTSRGDTIVMNLSYNHRIFIGCV
jgi:hypothetical protein